MLLLSLQFSCVKEPIEEQSSRRTVLFYLGVDNNLQAETDAKIKALASGWNHPESKLVIYRDQGATASLMEVTAHGTVVVKKYPSENSAARETLRRTIRDVMMLYPAQDYGLVVFSHGTGWLPQGMFSRSIIADSPSKSEMEISDFAYAMSDCHFKFVLFEACLMAGVEVAWELRNKTDYVVASASEMISPGFTDIYPTVREYLFLPEPDLIGAARTYYEHWNSKSGFSRSATISVLRSAGMQRLAEAVYPILKSAREVGPDQVACFDNSDYTNLYSDLDDYLRLKTEVPEQYVEFRQALDEVVAYQAATPYIFNRRLNAHCGLSIYLTHPLLPELNKAYKQTSWYRKMNSK